MDNQSEILDAVLIHFRALTNEPLKAACSAVVKSDCVLDRDLKEALTTLIFAIRKFDEQTVERAKTLDLVPETGRADLVAIVAGIERDDTTGVKAMLGGMSPKELTRLDLAAATDHGERLTQFHEHLNIYQTVDILIGLERHERAARAQRN